MDIFLEPKTSNCQISRNKGHSGKRWTVGKLEVLKIWNIFMNKNIQWDISLYELRTLNGNW